MNQRTLRRVAAVALLTGLCLGTSRAKAGDPRGMPAKYQRFVDAQPAALNTPAFPEADLRARLGTEPVGSSASSAPAERSSGSHERGLPFQDLQDYPDFYVIPAHLRPPVSAQGRCRSSVAWAASTALASVMGVRREKEKKALGFMPNMMPDPVQVFTREGRACHQGWRTNVGVDDLTKVGAPVSMVIPTSKRGENESSRTYLMPGFWLKAGRSGRLTNKDAMRKFLFEKGALVADMQLPRSFNYYRSGIYDHRKFLDKITAMASIRPPVKGIDAKQRADFTRGRDEETIRNHFNDSLGGHAMTVIGYFRGGKVKAIDFLRPILPPSDTLVATLVGDRTIEAHAFWIVQNSWARSWGMQGLMYIAANQRYEIRSNERRVQANTIDDQMYYMLDPEFTRKGKSLE